MKSDFSTSYLKWLGITEEVDPEVAVGADIGAGQPMHALTLSVIEVFHGHIQDFHKRRWKLSAG